MKSFFALLILFLCPNLFANGHAEITRTDFSEFKNTLLTCDKIFIYDIEVNSKSQPNNYLKVIENPAEISAVVNTMKNFINDIPACYPKYTIIFKKQGEMISTRPFSYICDGILICEFKGVTFSVFTNQPEIEALIHK